MDWRSLGEKIAAGKIVFDDDHFQIVFINVSRPLYVVTEIVDRDGHWIVLPGRHSTLEGAMAEIAECRKE